MNKVMTVLLFVFLTTPLYAASDFSYTYKNPTSVHAADYIVQKINVELHSEGSVTYWKPAKGAETLAQTSPGIIVYHFPFNYPIQKAELFISTWTYHWNYSQGRSLIFGSTDRNSWIKIAEADPPEFGQANSGSFQGSLPQSFIGAKDIWLKVELYSYGNSAASGGTSTNTAQHSRYDVNADNTTFRLEVDFQEPQVQGTKHQLDIKMNADVNIPDTSFGCSLAVVPGTVSGNVDLYVAIVLPGGTAYLLGPTELETDLVAYKTNIPAQNASVLILPEFPLPASLPNGTYNFLALLVKTGTDLANEQNWVSNVAARAMVFTPLSPAQKAFINELGYPLQFVKMFSHDGKDRRIDESWIYLKQGLGENFINGVFVHEETLQNSLADAPEGVNHPERYHMDTTLSQIKSWHGEPRKTFTENLDIGVYTTYTYDGIIFGFLDAQLIAVISGK
ncbi:MAG: hypothetical protein JRJ43_09335 [Deltaproteobacteria bacterium]|nr:hypothetical protein [Deltaproteobacteria bacterium]MBW1965544.1 hypothetical protein [Deltaproteobacteria bacterium]